MKQIKLRIKPHPKQRPYYGRGGRVFTPLATKRWENRVAKMLHDWCMIDGHKPYETPLKVTIYMVLQHKHKRGMCCFKPDIDNLAKSVLDAANNILWQDDSLITSLTLHKYYYKEPYVIIRIEEVDAFIEDKLTNELAIVLDKHNITENMFVGVDQGQENEGDNE